MPQYTLLIIKGFKQSPWLLTLFTLQAGNNPASRNSHALVTAVFNPEHCTGKQGCVPRVHENNQLLRVGQVQPRQQALFH